MLIFVSKILVMLWYIPISLNYDDLRFYHNLVLGAGQIKENSLIAVN